MTLIRRSSVHMLSPIHQGLSPINSSVANLCVRMRPKISEPTHPHRRSNSKLLVQQTIPHEDIVTFICCFYITVSTLCTIHSKYLLYVLYRMKPRIFCSSFLYGYTNVNNCAEPLYVNSVNAFHISFRRYSTLH